MYIRPSLIRKTWNLTVVVIAYVHSSNKEEEGFVVTMLRLSLGMTRVVRLLDLLDYMWLIIVK